jgi:hypothetical protein
VPDLPGVGQIHRDLRVLNPPGGPGVLALGPDGAAALLHITGLIDHQHRARVTEVLHHIIAQVIAHPVGVPDRPLQQVLHPIWCRVAGVLGD